MPVQPAPARLFRPVAAALGLGLGLAMATAGTVQASHQEPAETAPGAEETTPAAEMPALPCLDGPGCGRSAGDMSGSLSAGLAAGLSEGLSGGSQAAASGATTDIPVPAALALLGGGLGVLGVFMRRRSED